MNKLTDKVRARTLGLTLAAACAASLPVHAQEHAAASKQENIGVATGLTVGAVAGGPVGAIIGAAAGAWLGDRYHKQQVKNAGLATDLSKSETERTTLAKHVTDLHGSLQQSQQTAAQLDATVSRIDKLETDVGFRTNDASIDAKAMPPLLKIGALAASMPDARIRVAGYADPRGSEALNNELSQRRAEAVAAVLTQSGITRAQLIVEAHGKAEASTAEGDLDGYAFDRRVTVRLERTGDGTVASR